MSALGCEAATGLFASIMDSIQSFAAHGLVVNRIPAPAELVGIGQRIGNLVIQVIALVTGHGHLEIVMAGQCLCLLKPGHTAAAATGHNQNGKAKEQARDYRGVCDFPAQGSTGWFIAVGVMDCAIVLFHGPPPEYRCV